MQADNIRQFPRAPQGRPNGRARCTVRATGRDIPAVLRSVSALGAYVETDPGAIAVDTTVMLLHPEAGQIAARVDRVSGRGATLAFMVGQHAATFALAALCAAMTMRARPDDD